MRSRTCLLAGHLHGRYRRITCPNIVLILYGMDEVKDEVKDKVMDKIEDDVEDEIKDMFPGSSPSRALTPDTLALTSF